MVHLNTRATAPCGASGSGRAVGNGAGRTPAGQTESSEVAGHLVTAHLSHAVVPVIVFVMEVKLT